MIFPVVRLNRQVVDAGDAPLHEPMLVELPVFVAIRAPPMTCVVMPLVRETYGYTVSVKRPKLFGQSVIQFFTPLSGEKPNDRLAARQEL